jgi:hypothetical protein
LFSRLGITVPRGKMQRGPAVRIFRVDRRAGIQVGINTAKISSNCGF